MIVNHNQDWHTVPLGCRTMVMGGAERLCVNDYSQFYHLSPHSCRIVHTLPHTHTQQRGLLQTLYCMHTCAQNSCAKGSGPVTIAHCERSLAAIGDHSSTAYTCVQRGLWHIYSHMRLLCYDCYSTCEAARDQLFQCSYGITALPIQGVRYYIREDRLSLALIADPHMLYRPRFDLYT